MFARALTRITPATVHGLGLGYVELVCNRNGQVVDRADDRRPFAVDNPGRTALESGTLLLLERCDGGDNPIVISAFLPFSTPHA